MNTNSLLNHISISKEVNKIVVEYKKKQEIIMTMTMSSLYDILAQENYL
jgi:F0F1-type ATP synthase beta subunit